MELEEELKGPISCCSVASKGCQSSPKLPGWSKTGRRTRATRVHHQMPSEQTTMASDDELASENLPPKKRKLEGLIGRNGKDLWCKMAAKQHKCNKCSRSFSSYQALGGHKAHHNSKDHKVCDDGFVDDAVAVCGGAAVHRCTFCYKVFSKGQALGGHRRHCQRPITQNRAKIFSFDLNELPPEWLGSS